MKKNFICMITAVMLMTSLFVIPMPLTVMGLEGDDISQNETGVDVVEQTDEDITEPEPQSQDEPEAAEPDVELVNLEQCELSFKSSNYAYTGKKRIPVPVVKHGEKELIAGNDFDIVGYEDNLYPGKAKVIISGKGAYTGTAEAFFSIAKSSGLKSVTIKTDSIKLQWNKQNSVTGYRVYSYSVANKKWILMKTLKGYKNTSCTIDDLGAGYGYMFKVCAYVKDSSSRLHYGEYSTSLKVPTKPGKVTITKAYSSHSLNAWVKWNKKQGTGYQVKLSRKSNYSNSITYTVKSSSTLSKQTGKLRDKEKYYAKVRAYRTYGDKTVYGEWSASKTFKTDGTGWVTSGGKKYYYVKGKKTYGTKTIDGSKYYFHSDTGVLSGASYTMWKNVRNKSSDTKYLISTSRDLNRTCVYTGSKGKWTLKYYWKCTTGAAATRTPKGNFSTPTEKPKLRYMGHVDSYTCWYATRFYKRCYYHSVLFNYMSPVSIQDGRLGGNYSQGCVRLAKDNAKWLYDNIEPGTKVVIY